MKKTYDTPTLVVSGQIVDVTLGMNQGVELDGSSIGTPAPLGSVGFVL